MTTYSFSPSKGCFLLNANRENYELHGHWPDDATEVDDEIAASFVTTPPEGKRLGAAGDKPAWVNATE